MIRTTIFIDEMVEKDLKALARRKNLSTSAVIRGVLSQYVRTEKKKTGFSLSIVGIGRSGRHDAAETHEEWIWSDLGPHGPKSWKRSRRKLGIGKPSVRTRKTRKSVARLTRDRKGADH